MARDDFNKARTREILTKVLHRLVNKKTDMLSLQDAKTILKPKSENYRGMMTVPISLIVGSEGRYRDFNKEFLPKHQHLRSRWERVDMAYYKQINLPPIRLYKMGGVYFVRDGNHRVSVSRMKGVEFVDAEVVELTSEIEIKPWMTKEDLKREVIKFEKKKFFNATKLDKLRPNCILNFTAPGRYDDIIEHIKGHRYFLQEGR
ncbi:MAG: transcriptional regulator, partial [Spirochaetes bacterium]